MQQLDLLSALTHGPQLASLGCDHRVTHAIFSLISVPNSVPYVTTVQSLAAVMYGAQMIDGEHRLKPPKKILAVEGESEDVPPSLSVGYSSGQRGQTVNLLGSALHWFESSSYHHSSP